MRKHQRQLGKKIQKLRKQMGYSQERFAELLDVSRTHVGHVEQGRKSPSLELLEKIAKHLRVPLKELF